MACEPGVVSGYSPWRQPCSRCSAWPAADRPADPRTDRDGGSVAASALDDPAAHDAGRATATAPTPHAAPGRIVVVPQSIDATGRADDTKALQAFLDRVPDNRVIQFRRGGRYRVDGTLFLRNRHHLTIDGEGVVGVRDDARRAGTARSGGSRTARRSCSATWRSRARTRTVASARTRTFPSSRTKPGSTSRVSTAPSSTTSASPTCTATSCTSAATSTKCPSRNVWIHDSTFLRNGRQGIAVTAATNVIIEHNHFDDTRRSTIDLEPNAHSWHVSNVFVLNNTVGKGRLLFVASHGQGPGEQRRDLGQPATRPSAHDRRVATRKASVGPTGWSPTMSATQLCAADRCASPASTASS